MGGETRIESESESESGLFIKRSRLRSIEDVVANGSCDLGPFELFLVSSSHHHSLTVYETHKQQKAENAAVVRIAIKCDQRKSIRAVMDEKPCEVSGHRAFQSLLYIGILGR